MKKDMVINMGKLRSDEKENFIEVFLNLRKRSIRILLIAVLTGVLTGGVNHFLLPDYYSAAAKFQAGIQASNDYMILIKSIPALEKVIYEADVNMTPYELLDEMSITVLKETRIMEIRVSDYNPHRAEVLIQAFVKVAEIEYGNLFGLKVVENPSNAEPLPKKDFDSILRGFLLGGITAAVIISIKYIHGSKIRKAEEIEKLLNLSVLAVLPQWNEAADFVAVPHTYMQEGLQYAIGFNKRQKRRRIRHED